MMLLPVGGEVGDAAVESGGFGMREVGGWSTENADGEVEVDCGDESMKCAGA